MPLPCSDLRQQVLLVENKKANSPKGMLSRPGKEKYGISLLRETSIPQICDLMGWERMGYLYFQGQFRCHIFLFALKSMQQTIQGIK